MRLNRLASVSAGRRLQPDLLYGLFAAGNSDINFLSLNGADNGLHLVSAVAGVAIALWPADRTVPRQSGVSDRST